MDISWINYADNQWNVYLQIYSIVFKIKFLKDEQNVLRYFFLHTQRSNKSTTYMQDSLSARKFAKLSFFVKVCTWSKKRTYYQKTYKNVTVEDRFGLSFELQKLHCWNTHIKVIAYTYCGILSVDFTKKKLLGIGLHVVLNLMF